MGGTTLGAGGVSAFGIEGRVIYATRGPPPPPPELGAPRRAGSPGVSVRLHSRLPWAMSMATSRPCSATDTVNPMYPRGAVGTFSVSGADGRVGASREKDGKSLP
jgi:hypothetical protein